MSQTKNKTVARYVSSKLFKLLYRVAPKKLDFRDRRIAFRRLDVFHSAETRCAWRTLGERKREYRHPREIIIITPGGGVGVALEIRRVIARPAGKQCAEILLSPEAFPRRVRSAIPRRPHSPRCAKNYLAEASQPPAPLPADSVRKSRSRFFPQSSPRVPFVEFTFFRVCARAKLW